MQDLMTVFQVLVKIICNFVPLTLLMVAAVWVTTQLLD